MAAASLVGESVEDPGSYYENNFLAGLSLLDAMPQVTVSQPQRRRFEFETRRDSEVPVLLPPRFVSFMTQNQNKSWISY
jgi:hypothetical protein